MAGGVFGSMFDGGGIMRLLGRTMYLELVKIRSIFLAGFFLL
jgi:hypothetical protein